MLMQNEKLQSLVIIENEIRNDGMRQITEGLLHNNTLTKLDVRACGFSVEGIAS